MYSINLGGIGPRPHFNRHNWLNLVVSRFAHLGGCLHYSQWATTFALFRRRCTIYVQSKHSVWVEYRYMPNTIDCNYKFCTEWRKATAVRLQQQQKTNNNIHFTHVSRQFVSRIGAFSIDDWNQPARQPAKQPASQLNHPVSHSRPNHIHIYTHCICSSHVRPKRTIYTFAFPSLLELLTARFKLESLYLFPPEKDGCGRSGGGSDGSDGGGGDGGFRLTNAPPYTDQQRQQTQPDRNRELRLTPLHSLEEHKYK